MLPMKILFCALADRFAKVAMQTLPDAQAFCTAQDAPEALRLMEAECPSIVIVGGASSQIVADSCRRLRAAATGRDAILVAVTSGRPDDGRLLLESGADDLFVESLGDDELRNRLSVAHQTAAGIAFRVAEARTTKEALRELSESLATTLNSIGDGVIATDLLGDIVRMNPVAERLTGWAQAEARRRSLDEVLPLSNSETHVKVGNPVARALREGIVVSLPKDTLLTRRDGTAIPIADSCAPIRADDGTVNGAVLVFRDLSGQRNAEAVQAKFQKQLVFADRMAAVGTLAAGVAHEINNPLSFVVANVDMTLEEIRKMGGGAPSGRLREMEEMLLEARTGIARVTKIVRGLKSFSRIDEERPGVIDLLPVIDLAIDMTFNEIRHRARLVKEYGKVPLVDADDARLGQVFINLLVNAAQAFPEGNMDVNEIRIVTSTDADGRAVVEVRDTGSGIPPALLDRIFDPFFTTKSIGIGTGLGLAISHNIVAGMGGELLAQSEQGRGTAFRVILPASRSTQRSMPALNGHVKPTLARSTRVLVVDDEPAVGFAIRRILSHDDVTVVTSANDALDLLAAGKDFDVVLSDLMMPGVSGMELYREIVKVRPNIAPRVVFLTAGAFTPEAHKFLDHVANKRMTKPFDSNELRDMIHKFAGAGEVEPVVALERTGPFTG
jgi:PAS domain S-box-containing protein